MSPSNPEWYEELREEPVRTAGFTERLAWAIREEAQAGNRKGRIAWGKTLSYSAAIVGAAVIVLFSFLSKEAASPSPAGASPIASAAAGADAAEEVDAIAAKPEPTDEEWRRLTAADTTLVGGKQWIGTQSDEEGTAFVVWKVSHESAGNESISLGVNLWKWDDPDWSTAKLRWSTKQAGSTSLMKQNGVYYTVASNKYAAREDYMIVDNNAFGGENGKMYPYSLGIVIDPRIREVKIVSAAERPSIPVQLMEADGETYWFALLPSGGREYTIEWLDADGRAVYTETRYYSS
ncbi:hypothetical protein [Cohnella fermenti]|uniref:Uncharacterized protein n=1 Tax=Cohnella fermenti TaxID=2565925 RepID=A0A4S4C7C1_9BACL|nr:hypothetical protein [Cohnella fermenti]THF81677.1 hypothetical protein E6C55_08075 [Cohnella fermenti]